MKEFLSIPMSYAGGSYWVTAGFTPTVGGIYYYTPDTGTTYYACVCTVASGNTAAAIPSATSGTFTSASNSFYIMSSIPKLTAAAWSATAYSIGDYVTTSSKLYVCGEAGTASAAPTTTTKGVLDGTGAKFYYVSASLLATSANSVQLTGTVWTSALDLYVGDIVYYGQDVYAVINTTAASTATAAKLPIPSVTGASSQYYKYLFTLGSIGLIGLDNITTVEITSTNVLTINSYNGAARTTRLYFPVADANYASHYAIMQAISDAFSSRKSIGISSNKIPVLPTPRGGVSPSWVSTVIYS
jgi:hypothetical protein